MVDLRRRFGDVPPTPDAAAAAGRTGTVTCALTDESGHSASESREASGNTGREKRLTAVTVGGRVRDRTPQEVESKLIRISVPLAQGDSIEVKGIGGRGIDAAMA